MKRARQKHNSNQASGSIRVIAGKWRGRKLAVLDAEGLRPTTDRNKETLFNWLMHDTRNAQCLDMFAGSGGLGIEALSRDASHCVFFEKSAQNVKQLLHNLKQLNAQADVLTGDALTLLSEIKHTFDIVFIDPPFGHSLVQNAIDALIRHNVLSDNALIYVEQESTIALPVLPPNATWIKQKHTNALFYGLIQVASE